jgi:type I restriction enzyme S subunit
VQNGRLSFKDNVFVEMDFPERVIVKEGDILICSRNGSQRLIGKNICIDEQMEGNTFGAFMMICRSEYWKFLYEFFNSQIFKSQSGLFLTATINQLTSNTLNNFYLAIPKSFNEQTAIANYLDHKTAQIDDLIAKKEKLIELLKEERIATINQAVTKGLDLNVPMKDSGIEWLGEIPESWEVKSLRYIGKCKTGISAGAEYFGSGFPFVSYGDVYKNEILPETVNGLANSTEKDQEHYSAIENDVFFTRTSETIEEIGIASTCMKTIDNSVFAGFLIRFRPFNETLHKGFSKYFFRCFIPRVFFVKEMNIVTRASLSQELLKRLPVLLPNIDEQIKIAEYLDMQTNCTDKLIEKNTNQISLLKEYKTALISEVVTGKIDVRKEENKEQK